MPSVGSLPRCSFSLSTPDSHKQQIGIVYFEVCPALTRQAGFAPDSAVALLEDCGYSLYRLAPEGTLVETQGGGVGDVELENWVALRSCGDISASV